MFTANNKMKSFVILDGHQCFVTPGLAVSVPPLWQLALASVPHSVVASAPCGMKTHFPFMLGRCRVGGLLRGAMSLRRLLETRNSIMAPTIVFCS